MRTGCFEPATRTGYPFRTSIPMIRLPINDQIARLSEFAPGLVSDASVAIRIEGIARTRA